MHRILSLILFAVMAASAGAVDVCPDDDPASPRTLILALDGVPYRTMRTAREMGAFEGWGPTRPLVSTFPSMTNVGFTAILSPFHEYHIPGYELRRFDADANRVAGGGVGDVKFAWREQFDLQQSGFWDKVGIYMTPRSKTLKGVRRVGEYVLGSSEEIVMGLVSSTDSLTHVYGEVALVDTLRRISDEVESLRRLHLQSTGRPLQVVMLSDHGNVGRKVRRADGVRRLLRDAGLRPSAHLRDPDDVVPVTYGVVGYGVLYTDPTRGETAARALLGLEGLDVVAWREGPNRLHVTSPEGGEADVEWRDLGPQRAFAYRPAHGDPLRAVGARDRMAALGLLDADGFGRRDDWFRVSALDPYPDALTRLVDALFGVWVENAATVIFSFEPGWAWGARSVEVGAWLRGGKLEQTHGGLDRESSLGFFMTSDPESDTRRAMRADRALRPWAERSRCTTAVRIRVGPEAHPPRVVR